jgi:hypothetical protein
MSISKNSQIPTGEHVVTIRPYFCFWKMGQMALAHCRCIIGQHSCTVLLTFILTLYVPLNNGRQYRRRRV